MDKQQIDDNGDSDQEAELPTVKLSIYRIGCIIRALFGIIIGWNLRELFYEICIY